jgi:hypothetical protein
MVLFREMMKSEAFGDFKSPKLCDKASILREHNDNYESYRNELAQTIMFVLFSLTLTL